MPTIALLALALPGCITAPAVPAGPLQGTSVTAAGALGYAIAPSEVTLEGSGGRTRFSDASGDGVNLPFLPVRFGGRVGITDFIDVGGDIAAYDGGLDIRAGLPERLGPLPFTLGFGLRRGGRGWKSDDEQLGASAMVSHTEQRLRLELYPRLAHIPVGVVNGIAALGVSWGKRYHPLFGPERLAAPAELDEHGGSIGDLFDASRVDFDLLRDETRIELAVGAELRRGKRHHFALTVVLMPYWVTSAGPIRQYACSACSDWQATAYDSNFGVSLFLAGSVTAVLHRFVE